jgi:hypothetical protein
MQQNANELIACFPPFIISALKTVVEAELVPKKEELSSSLDHCRASFSGQLDARRYAACARVEVRSLHDKDDFLNRCTFTPTPAPSCCGGATAAAAAHPATPSFAPPTTSPRPELHRRSRDLQLRHLRQRQVPQ